MMSINMQVFARIVQLCTLQDTIWMFLEGVKSTGIPIARVNIVKRCHKDAALLKLLCDHVYKASRLAYSGASTHIQNGADRLVTFFASLCLELCSTHTLVEAHIRALYLFIKEGIRYTAPHASITSPTHAHPLRRAACMVIAQLCRTCTLSTQLLHGIVKALGSAFTSAGSEAIAEDAVIALSIVLTLQKVIKAL